MSEPQGNTIGRTFPAGYHSRNKAAKLVGRSADTLKRWHDEGIFVCTHTVQYGDLTVWAYSDDDIKILQAVAANMKPGRKKDVA